MIDWVRKSSLIHSILTIHHQRHHQQVSQVLKDDTFGLKWVKHVQSRTIDLYPLGVTAFSKLLSGFSLLTERFSRRIIRDCLEISLGNEENKFASISSENNTKLLEQRKRVNLLWIFLSLLSLFMVNIFIAYPLKKQNTQWAENGNKVK